MNRADHYYAADDIPSQGSVLSATRKLEL